jgi:hypothetical protein
LRHQAWPYIGEPRFDLAARPLLPQHDAAAPILADEVERILADIDPDYGDFAIEFLGHGALLCLRCPGQLASAGRGVGARPDHPISRPTPSGQDDRHSAIIPQVQQGNSRHIAVLSFRSRIGGD